MKLFISLVCLTLIATSNSSRLGNPVFAADQEALMNESNSLYQFSQRVLEISGMANDYRRKAVSTEDADQSLASSAEYLAYYAMGFEDRTVRMQKLFEVAVKGAVTISRTSPSVTEAVFARDLHDIVYSHDAAGIIQAPEIRVVLSEATRNSRLKISPAKLTILSQVIKSFGESIVGSENLAVWTGILANNVNNMYRQRGSNLVGIGQLSPKNVSSYKELCGFSDIRASDLNDDTLNIVLSACVFGSLLASHDGNRYLAALDYLTHVKNGTSPLLSRPLDVLEALDRNHPVLRTPEARKSVFGIRRTMGNLQTKSEYSDGRRAVLARLIAATAYDSFRDWLPATEWIVLLTIESHLKTSATSSVGAVGVGQLMPKYARDFGKTCFLSDIHAGEIRQDAVNLALSACYFKELRRRNKGKLSLALVSYNAGPHSNALNALKSLSNMPPEPANYVAKHRHCLELYEAESRAYEAETMSLAQN